MKSYKFKLGRILITVAVSTATMAAATTLNNVSTVHADTVSDSSVVNTDSQTRTADDIVTGTWGTAPYTWNKTTGVVVIGSGEAGSADDVPWRFAHTPPTKSITFTGKVTLRPDSYEVFARLPEVTYIGGMNNLDTSNVTNMASMFYNDYKLESVDLSSFDTSNVTNMSQMFYGDHSLHNLDVSNLDTSNVTDMSYMFLECPFTNLDLSNFNTSKVTNMYGMFENNRSLKSLDLRSFDTSNVKGMWKMFYIDTSLKELNLSSFDTSKVTTMADMFYDTFRLKTLALGTKTKLTLDSALLNPPTTGDYLGEWQAGDYSGKWENIKDVNGNNINNGNTYTTNDLLTNYTPDKAGTYVWEKKSKDVSDIKDLYNNVKLAISYSAGMFNSEPGNSLKYKDEFNGRSIYGALDYAYNSNNYNELIKVIHDSLAKAHESIGSLQVNDAKAQELGLNTDQLKEDLIKDSVPYDYSKDNDIDGINKQLDSFASVRAKYNKLVKQGVFDKSDYWTINK